MAPPPAPQQQAGQPQGGNMLTRKVGPLATWIWLVIITVLAVGYYLYEKNKSGSSSSTAAADSVNASQVPDYIVQNYIGSPGGGTTPPATTPPPTTPPPVGTVPPGTVPPTAPPPKGPNPGGLIKTPAPPKGPNPGGGIKPKAPKPGAQQYTTVTVAKWSAKNTPWNSTLSGIAEHYSVQGGYEALAKLNGIKNANLIYPGQKIKVPVSTSKKK